MRAILTVIWRLLAFIGKELVETIRRPGAIVSLVLGPFLSQRDAASDLRRLKALGGYDDARIIR